MLMTIARLHCSVRCWWPLLFGGITLFFGDLVFSDGGGWWWTVRLQCGAEFIPFGIVTTTVVGEHILLQYGIMWYYSSIYLIIQAMEIVPNYWWRCYLRRLQNAFLLPVRGCYSALIVFTWLLPFWWPFDWYSFVDLWWFHYTVIYQVWTLLFVTFMVFDCCWYSMTCVVTLQFRYLLVVPYGWAGEYILGILRWFIGWWLLMFFFGPLLYNYDTVIPCCYVDALFLFGVISYSHLWLFDITLIVVGNSAVQVLPIPVLLCPYPIP